jgi:superfamily II DNA or RNA helicase
VTDWVYVPRLHQWGRVIDRATVFGQSFAHVWIPATETVVRVTADEVEEPNPPGLDEIRYRAYAARIIQSLQGDVLLAPLESRVIPLPHQIQVLDRVITGQRTRLLLADEVGLGKTIEAGLVIRELKLRRMVKRILVVAPKGLLNQWANELDTHFEERFGVVTGEDLRSSQSSNVWSQGDQLIVSQDGIKPLSRRRGWEADRIAEYNQRRYEAVLAAGWDLIVVDEAHRLGGSTDAVARFRLGQGLAAAASYLLLLTATPHQGKTDQFRRLLSLLDADQFIETASLDPSVVRPYVVRTAKRAAVDGEGKPLFQPRRVEMVVVQWDDPRYATQRELYEAVTLYVRQGYRKAVTAKAYSQTFLLILLQRMVTSSPAAIERAVRRRLDAVEDRGENLWTVSDDDEIEQAMDQDAPANERKGLEGLLQLATRAVNSPDARVDRLLALIDDVRGEELSETKFLIFTEFLPTQAMLARILTGYGYQVSVLNGEMDLAERMRVQEAFRNQSQFLVSTDAGGEGLNLQFAHVVMNYDLPWNPMRIEQRIGRVDRIGQRHVVRAFNFAMEGTVEYRVHEVLLEKLRRILDELGVDKLGDVLDSSGLDVDYQDLYIESVIHPEGADRILSEWVERVRETADSARGLNQTVEAGLPDLNRLKNVLHHPLPRWMAAMVEHYIIARGGKIERTTLGWTIEFPDGLVVPNAVFRSDREDADQTHLSLDHPRIQTMLEQLPHVLGLERLSCLASAEFPAGIGGIWSLWELSLLSRNHHLNRIVPLLVSEDGHIFRTSAQQVWEQITHPKFSAVIEPSKRTLDNRLYQTLFEWAEREAEPLYRDLKEAHSVRMAEEIQKMDQAYAVRRQLVERLGLLNVREARLRRLAAEQEQRRRQLGEELNVHPELRPILIVEVQGR